MNLIIMNFKVYLIGCFVVTTLFSCKKSDPKPVKIFTNPNTAPSEAVLPPTPDHILKNYELAWSDEFEGSQLDLTKWSYRAEGTIRNLATVSRNTVKLDGQGNLQLMTLKDPDGTYYVGQAATNASYLTKYGYFECRAKMNESIGPHVAFWLQSNTMGVENNNPAVNGTEIDIFEYHRKKPELLFHNLHWNGYGSAHKTIGTKIGIPDIGNGYHTFGLEWTETEYIFYVDGKETWRTSTAVSKTEQYVILSTELTGFGGDPLLGTFPDRVLFDYVRVYKAK
ncbi:MAG TPA: glycoside hydrolase family 16 protein [Pelobium sp.]|nr:glycoside hydrolase family 16 protein [Pelobium sp.]